MRRATNQCFSLTSVDLSLSLKAMEKKKKHVLRDVQSFGVVIKPSGWTPLGFCLFPSRLVDTEGYL